MFNDWRDRSESYKRVVVRVDAAEQVEQANARSIIAQLRAQNSSLEKQLWIRTIT